MELPAAGPSALLGDEEYEDEDEEDEEGELAILGGSVASVRAKDTSVRWWWDTWACAG